MGLRSAGKAGGSNTSAAGPESEAPLGTIARLGQKSLPGRQVRLEADANGHFQGNFRLNGRSLTAMVDTGATLVAINASTARRIGIHLSPADFRHQVATANGPAKAAAAKIASLRIGTIEASNVPAVVLEDGSLNGTLIGMSFLGQLKRFEIRDGILLLVQ